MNTLMIDSTDNDDAIDSESMRENQRQVIDNLAHRMGNPRFSALRAQNPFVAMVQMPNSTIAFTLAATTAITVDIPSGTKYIFISASAEYYVTRQGQAQMPPAAGQNPDVQSGAHSPPVGYCVYVEEIKQLSFIAPNAGTRIAIGCYQQN